MMSTETSTAMAGSSSDPIPPSRPGQGFLSGMYPRGGVPRSLPPPPPSSRVVNPHAAVPGASLGDAASRAGALDAIAQGLTLGSSAHRDASGDKRTLQDRSVFVFGLGESDTLLRDTAQLLRRLTDDCGPMAGAFRFFKTAPPGYPRALYASAVFLVVFDTIEAAAAAVRLSRSVVVSGSTLSIFPASSERLSAEGALRVLQSFCAPSWRKRQRDEQGRPRRWLESDFSAPPRLWVLVIWGSSPYPMDWTAARASARRYEAVILDESRVLPWGNDPDAAVVPSESQRSNKGLWDVEMYDDGYSYRDRDGTRHFHSHRTLQQQHDRQGDADSRRRDGHTTLSSSALADSDVASPGSAAVASHAAATRKASPGSPSSERVPLSSLHYHRDSSMAGGPPSNSEDFRSAQQRYFDEKYGRPDYSYDPSLDYYGLGHDVMRLVRGTARCGRWFGRRAWRLFALGAEEQPLRMSDRGEELRRREARARQDEQEEEEGRRRRRPRREGDDDQTVPLTEAARENALVRQGGQRRRLGGIELRRPHPVEGALAWAPFVQYIRPVMNTFGFWLRDEGRRHHGDPDHIDTEDRRVVLSATGDRMVLAPTEGMRFGGGGSSGSSRARPVNQRDDSFVAIEPGANVRRHNSGENVDVSSGAWGLRPPTILPSSRASTNGGSGSAVSPTPGLHHRSFSSALPLYTETTTTTGSVAMASPSSLSASLYPGLTTRTEPRSLNDFSRLTADNMDIMLPTGTSTRSEPGRREGGSAWTPSLSHSQRVTEQGMAATDAPSASPSLAQGTRKRQRGGLLNTLFGSAREGTSHAAAPVRFLSGLLPFSHGQHPDEDRGNAPGERSLDDSLHGRPVRGRRLDGPSAPEVYALGARTGSGGGGGGVGGGHELFPPSSSATGRPPLDVYGGSAQVPVRSALKRTATRRTARTVQDDVEGSINASVSSLPPKRSRIQVLQVSSMSANVSSIAPAEGLDRSVSPSVAARRTVNFRLPEGSEGEL